MTNSLRISATCAILGATSLAPASDFLDWNVAETVWNYKATFLHDGIFFSHTHLVDHVGSVLWKVWGPFVCDTGFLSDDTMAWAVANQHQVAPHQEAPGVIVTWADVETPGKAPDINFKFVTLEAEQSVHGHGEHYDVFNTKGIYKLSHFAGIDKVEGFADIMRGMHTDNPDAVIQIDSTSVEDLLHSSDDDSVGVSSYTINPSTGEFDASLAILAQPPGSLIQVTLNLGGPGQVGPVILDLGGQGLWQSRLDGTAVSRDFNGQFPMQHMGSLLSGQVYLQVTNAQHPFGSIRGQLTKTPYGVRPSSMSVVRGTAVNGSVASVEASDDTMLVLQKNVVPIGTTSELVQVAFTGWSWVTNPQTLRIQAETSVSLPNALQRVYLQNQFTQQFEMVDQRPVSQTESKLDVSVNNQPGRFVKADGTVVAKLGFVALGPQPKYWTASVDKVHWVLSR